jgi:hypothetical protein
MEIDMAKFYNIGMWLFGIVALMNTMTYINGFINPVPNVTIPMYISGGASLLFNYLIFGFFSYLKSTLPPKNLEQGSLKEMEEFMLDDLNDKGGKTI